MSTTNFLRLVFLAAIWGSSFLFMRICAPVLGPAVLIEYRVLLAAIFLLVVATLLKKPLGLRRYWKHYLILGLFNSAFPFLMFAFAARTLSASVLSVLNATAPMFGALITALWARQAISARTALGLVLGTAGVALLVGFDHVSARPGAGWAIAAALVAAFSYSVASAYTRTAVSVDPFTNAHGSMWASALLVLPLLPLFPAPGTPTIGIMGATLALGVLCSAIAYIIYFRLIADIGTTSALTVTFLSPLFGILWGTLFLHEVVGWYTIAGAAIVLTGTALVTGFDWVLWVFGAFLLITGLRLLIQKDKDDSPPNIERHPVARLVRRVLPVTPTLHGERFLVRMADKAGRVRLHATPPLLALAMVEVADVVFAVDSIPAVFAITQEPLLVYTSNIFAILGLRALYFALAALVHRFEGLKPALALVLVFIGAKIFYSHFFGKLDPAISLAVTLAILVGGVLYSLWKTRGDKKESLT